MIRRTDAAVEGNMCEAEQLIPLIRIGKDNRWWMLTLECSAAEQGSAGGQVTHMHCYSGQ